MARLLTPPVVRWPGCRNTSPGRLISLKAEVESAPHSTDLSPLNFFLWGYLKDRVYKEKPRTTDALKTAIMVEVARLPSEMVDRKSPPDRATAGADPPEGGSH